MFPGSSSEGKSYGKQQRDFTNALICLSVLVLLNIGVSITSVIVTLSVNYYTLAFGGSGSSDGGSSGSTHTGNSGMGSSGIHIFLFFV